MWRCLASPWPLKIVLDSVFDAEPMPPAFAWLLNDHADRLARLNLTVVATIVIALLRAASAYLNAYYPVSIGQWIAHDLRHSVYAHLQRLSMSYYDKGRSADQLFYSPKLLPLSDVKLVD